MLYYPVDCLPNIHILSADLWILDLKKRTRALKKMNLKTKSNIWYIGDHPINDIMGAKKHINATTLHKLHNGVERSYGKFKADLEFNSYNDLLDLLKNIKKKV